MAKKKKYSEPQPQESVSEADKDLLAEARERLKDCVNDEAPERHKMEDDLRFCTLDQWDAEIRRERENDPNGPRPCLTIDKINQYIVQVVNDMRQNRAAVKIRPVDDVADPQTAKVYQGLLRHIEDASDAPVGYETAGESAVKIGLGYFRVGTRYVDDGSGDQEIYVGRIPNAFSVYLAPHIQPDGSDAEYGFVLEEMAVEKFKVKYPGKKYSVEDFDDLKQDVTGWRSAETITVCEYFYTEYGDATGDEIDIRPKSIKWCKMTGMEVLDRRDWPGKYIPIVEVVGRESWVKGRRVLWGLVRPAKDSLRMNNYWMSAITEKIGLAPKVPFIGAKGQFEGVEAAWKAANRENRAYLEYNAIDVQGNAIPAPQRVQPAPMEVAMVNMTALIERDVKAALGMYKAAVGESESQQSGRAILALQKESDTGTLHFADNLHRSIRHGGRIMVDLIPKIYDTRRIIRILGEDGEPQTVQLDPEQQASMSQVRIGDKVKSIYNLGVGRYDVTVTVGPSYTTKRQEVATLFTELANSAKDPISSAVMRYIAVKNSDFEQSEEALRMLKALLPPQLQQNDQQVPPQVQAKMMQMDQMAAMAAQKIKELESGEAQAQAKISADGQAKQAQIAADAQAAQVKAAQEAEVARLEDARKREESDTEAKLAVYKARLDAQTKVKVAVIAAECKLHEANIGAETDQNIAFMQGMADKETADADRDAEAQNAEADRDAETMMNEAAVEGNAEAPAPKGGMRDVMTGMVQMMAQMAQINQSMMQAMQTQHDDMMKMMGEKKTISGTLPSGAHFSAVVH